MYINSIIPQGSSHGIEFYQFRLSSVLCFEVCQKIATRWHFVCFLVLSFGVWGSVRRATTRWHFVCFLVLSFCQKSNYQVTFRLFSCFEFLSEEQLPGDISSVFLFWVLVFEVLSEEQLPGDISCFLVLSFGVWGSVRSNYQVTFRLFSCFEFWCSRSVRRATTRWHFVCFLVLSFGVWGSVRRVLLPSDLLKQISKTYKFKPLFIYVPLPRTIS
jgi:hypothetical protein